MTEAKEYRTPYEIYYGTKKIKAWRADRVIKDTDEAMEGYGVEYEDGYESWSPKDAFEKAYRPSGKMNFGHALFALKEGMKVRRWHWDSYDPTWAFVEIDPKFTFSFMLTHSNSSRYGWTPEYQDLVAEDWMVVE